jgi:hypothetical protein
MAAFLKLVGVSIFQSSQKEKRNQYLKQLGLNPIDTAFATTLYFIMSTLIASFKGILIRLLILESSGKESKMLLEKLVSASELT